MTIAHIPLNAAQRAPKKAGTICTEDRACWFSSFNVSWKSKEASLGNTCRERFKIASFDSAPIPGSRAAELEAEVERERLRGSGRRPSGFPVRKLRHANLHGQFVSPIREKTTRRDPQIEHNVSS